MNTARNISATLFSIAANALLCTIGWKRKTVLANTALMQKGSCNKPDYGTLIRNMSRHLSEMLFKFSTFKNLPQHEAEYPYTCGHTSFRLDESSRDVIRKMKSGGIFLTAHYGNYESIGPWLVRLQIPLKASYARIRPRILNKFLENRIRAVGEYRYSVNPINPREFLRMLDCGELFCLVADQDSRIPHAVGGRFFKTDVHNNPLPAFLLRNRPKTPVFICWIQEDANARTLHAKQLENATEANVMDRFNYWLESRVNENPNLWYGFTHRRFKSTNPDIYR